MPQEQMFMLVAVKRGRGKGPRTRSGQVILGVCEEELCNQYLATLRNNFDVRLEDVDHVELVAVPDSGMHDFFDIPDRYDVPLG